MKRKELATNEDYNNTFLSSQHLESEARIIATHIFGPDSLNIILMPDPLSKELSEKTILQNTNVWIHQVLDNMEPSLNASEEDTRPGRLGLTQVRFDSTAQIGTLIMSPDRLHAQAQSNFSSVKANVCFYSGKWQYELQLESKGVMQLGWAMADGEFTPETGVGDTVYSYSFDGNRVRKWNLVTSEYGEAWQMGDIIGCTIDLDQGNIHFYRNGRDLGEAFSSIPLGPGSVYFPAISLAFEEKVQTNFGSLPFKYPVESYLPVQQPPLGAVKRTNQLLHWLFRIPSITKPKNSNKVNHLCFITQPQSKGKSEDERRNQLSADTTCVIFCEILFSHLSGLLSQPYVIEACVVPFLHDITAVSGDKKGLPSTKSLVKLDFFCDAVMLLFEPDDFKELINTICKCLIQKFNQTSESLEYTKQKSCLALFADLCQNANIRLALLKQPGFVKTRIPEFMDLKPIDVRVLKESVPESWWHEEAAKGIKSKEYEIRKKNYFENCKNIKTKTIDLETMQDNLLLLFLNNNDSSVTEPSSRKCFLHMFRMFLKDNHLSGLVSFFLNNQSVEQTPLPVALSYFHRLVNVLRGLWEKECSPEPVHVPLSTFYNGSVDYFSIDRLGGVLSYLIHTFRPALEIQLGQDHTSFLETTVQPNMLPSVQVQVRGIDTNTGVISTLTRWINIGNSLPTTESGVPDVVPLGTLDSAASLAELLDGVILLYSIAAHKQLYKVSTLRDDMEKYVNALNEAKARLTLAKESCPEAAVEIETSIQTFQQKIEEQSRVLMAWVRGAIYTPEKRANLIWLLKAVLRTLEMASEQGDLFAFVPDFYVETVVEITSALRNYFSPTLPLQEYTGYKQVLVQVAEFLVKHLSDPRIVNLGSKDTVVEALAGFIAKKQTMECLESVSTQSKERFVGLLLKPYDNRPWGQTNWILMRMWQGFGFAFRYQKSPHLTRKLGPRTPSSDSSLLIHQAFEPCPSPQFQALVASQLFKDQEMAAEFLNSVLKQLNWSFSEFISMMQEIQNLSKRPERVIIDARQLKICATCFDFVISLLRVLEMLCTTCLPVLTDASRENTENLLERLCQLLSQILLRVTTPTGCFTHVISLEVPDLDAIDQFPVLSAVVGVLVALLAEDIAFDKENAAMSTAAKSLLSEPAFKIDSLKYVLGELQTTNEKQEIFSFLNYPQAVNVIELESVSHMISVLTRYQARMSITKDVDDEELCPICCAMPLAVTFMPCHHRSCKSCITHHLMDCKECFFCKAAIKSVIATDGKLLFDSNTSVHKATEHSAL